MKGIIGKKTWMLLGLLVLIGCSSDLDAPQFADVKILDLEGVVALIQASGAAAETLGITVTPNIFQGVEPEEYLEVNGEQISTIVYPSLDLAEQDRNKVSSDGLTVTTESGAIDFDGAPFHWYSTSNVIVLYVGDNAELTQALSGVFGPRFAGPQ